MSTPWQSDPTRYGRVRLSEDMAKELLDTIDQAIDVLWEERRKLPNPSNESYAALKRIRRLEKIRRNVEGTAIEKGWI